MLTIGLCGGSGSGKGYVSGLFLNYGIPSIDNKIPANQRDAMWLLCTQDEQIVWLISLKYSGLYQPQQTDTITHIFLYRKNKKLKA